MKLIVVFLLILFCACINVFEDSKKEDEVYRIKFYKGTNVVYSRWATGNVSFWEDSILFTNAITKKPEYIKGAFIVEIDK